MRSAPPEADPPVLVLGEALVDQFKEGAVPGGAPFNVARSLSWLGAPVTFVTRIGADDAAGRLLLDSAARYGLGTAVWQRDTQRATGAVSVHEEAGGGHRFEIHADAAWDHIEPPKGLASGGLVYFGTLAQRCAVSRDSLRAAVKRARGRAFLDLNLRPGTELRELAAESLMLADWVKVNDDELALLLSWFAPEGVAALMGRFALQQLIVTRGAAGYVLYGENGVPQLSGGGVAVPVLVDTVGAGDAFTAMLLAGLALRRPLDVTLALANRYAATICSLRGPLPADPAVLQPWRDALHALRVDNPEAQA